MKYEMPALTDEQREQLIKFGESVLEQFESDNYKFTNHEFLVRIALASMTAEPIHEACYRTYYPDTEDESHRPHSESGELCARRIAGELGGYVEKVIHIADGENAYTAPPVPALKLPEGKPDWESEDGQDIDYMEPSDVYAMGKDDGFNNCLAEVKRLNGLN